MTDDLVSFLRARLDEDEQKARAAMWAGDERWASHKLKRFDMWIVDDSYDESVAEIRAHAADTGAVARHIARHDPVRVLAEDTAKRAIIDVHVDRAECTRCERFDGELYPCDTLKLLASVYADHPDYRKEWTP